MVDKIRALGVIVGVAYLLAGVAMISDTVALIDRGVETTALLVKYYYDGILYYPVLEFKDEAGSTVTAQSTDSVKRTYDYKSRTPIIYDQANPTVGVRINTFATLWAGPTFLISSGAFVAILSLGLHARWLVPK